MNAYPVQEMSFRKGWCWNVKETNQGDTVSYAGVTGGRTAGNAFFNGK